MLVMGVNMFGGDNMMSHFYAVLFRMKYINRWALMRNTGEENLSEHSLETAFIAHALAVISNKRLGKNLNAERAALLALFHDTPEIITGDLPTPVKYYNSEIAGSYKVIENEAIKKIISLAPQDMRDEFECIYYETDAELLSIVKAADKIAALIKCLEELKMGNREFAVAEVTTREKIKALNCAAADIFIDEFIGSFSLSLDEQGIL